MSRFESDFANRRGGIGVKFDGTNECHHFLWNTILDYPSTFLFFGAPLSQCRSFDSIFNDCKSTSTIHHRFLAYYHEFEGDVQACLALYNAYLHKRSYILAQNVGKLKLAEKKHDKDIFKSNDVVEFLDEIDDCFRTSLESVFTEFKDHSRPVVETDVVLGFIDQAPKVFRDTWVKMCEWRGVTNRV